MNFIFFGSDRSSCVTLTSLLALSHTPSLVVTKSGSELENLANKSKIDILIYQDNQDKLFKYITDDTVGLSASFPYLFPPALIQKFAGHLYNLHPSLLPQYRNVAPVPYALAMGDTVTGISAFPVRVGIDNGPLVAQLKEEITPEDTTPILLERLFLKGTELFLKYLKNPLDPSLTKDIPVYSSRELIFTRKLTRNSSFIEWPVLQKLINKERIFVNDTTNPLVTLRLTHHPERTDNILPDLIRALDGYERVWSLVKTQKGEFEVSITASYQVPSTKYYVQIPGKPRPIPYPDFAKYYL